MKLGAAHPMGPLTLSDFVGLDVIKNVANIFSRNTATARSRRRRCWPAWSHRQLGRKSGKGFYDYSSK